MSREEVLLSLDKAIYLDKEYVKNNFSKTDSIKINANIKDEELDDINFKNKKYLIIDMDASASNQQKRFISIIKDKCFKSITLDNDIKIIVSSSDLDIIVDEVKGLIVV